MRALEWIDGPGDPDCDGFVEYARETEHGLSNQGWKDSHDAIFHSDGSLAVGPIALVEVQGYVYAAKLAAAGMASDLGLEARAQELREQAAALRQNFERHFWCEDIGFYAVALDGKKMPVRVRSSNAAHALCTGIASDGRAAGVVGQILKPSFFSGWGIRTIATSEARYNPMSYHNGSIWPHDNSMIAAGLARYGFKQGVETIFDGLLDAAADDGPAPPAGIVLRVSAAQRACANLVSCCVLAPGLVEWRPFPHPEFDARLRHQRRDAHADASLTFFIAESRNYIG